MYFVRHTLFVMHLLGCGNLGANDFTVLADDSDSNWGLVFGAVLVLASVTRALLLFPPLPIFPPLWSLLDSDRATKDRCLMSISGKVN